MVDVSQHLLVMPWPCHTNTHNTTTTTINSAQPSPFSFCPPLPRGVLGLMYVPLSGNSSKQAAVLSRPGMDVVSCRAAAAAAPSCRVVSMSVSRVSVVCTHTPPAAAPPTTTTTTAESARLTTAAIHAKCKPVMCVRPSWDGWMPAEHPDPSRERGRERKNQLFSFLLYVSGPRETAGGGVRVSVCRVFAPGKQPASPSHRIASLGSSAARREQEKKTWHRHDATPITHSFSISPSRVFFFSGTSGW